MIVFRTLACCFILLQSILVWGQLPFKTNSFNLKFKNPGKGSESSMVLGNGYISANVWVNKADGDMYFYIGKTDANNYLDLNVKVGKIKVHFEPNILADADYEEEFHLDNVSYTIKTAQGNVKMWIDANNPQIIIQAQSNKAIKMSATVQLMRPKEKPYGGINATFTKKYNPVEEADSIVKNRKKDVLFYHRNKRSDLFDVTMDLTKMSGKGFKDPLVNLTFGALMRGNNFIPASDSTLVSKKDKKQHELRISVLTAQTETTKKWVDSISNLAITLEKVASKKMFKDHTNYWEKFWNKSYVNVQTNPSTLNDTLQQVNKNYLYQRYLLAAGGRGNGLIYFNGGIFTTDTYTYSIKTTINTVKGKSADYRNWELVRLWQNNRLPYLPLMETGDLDLINPFFDYYINQAYPLNKLFTNEVKKQKGVSFEECLSSWGSHNLYTYGYDRKGKNWGGEVMKTDSDLVASHLQDHILCGPELLNYMLDYYEYNDNETFAETKIIPIARDIVDYFDLNFLRDSAGKLNIYPAKVMETYPDVQNPIVYIGALQFILPRLIKLPFVAPDFKLQCSRLLSELPDFYTTTIDNQTILKPAEKMTTHTNLEQPELYVVYPFRLFGVGKPNLDLAISTFNTPSIYGTVDKNWYKNKSVYKTPFGTKERIIASWHTTGVHAAYLGLTKASSEIVVRNFLNNDRGFRFPCFYSNNTFDYVPEMEQGAIAMKNMHVMLLQSDENTIRLLPTWPKNWDVQFKLNAPHNTVVEVKYTNGKIETLKVTPESRLKDVIYPLD